MTTTAESPGRTAPVTARTAPLLAVLVVLEGQAREAEPEGANVVHAPGSGDEALAARCGPGVLLVTADRGLRARAEAAGAEVVGPSWLLGRLPEAWPP